MPTPITCSHCGKVAQLPDAWKQPGFECPHCKQANRLPIPRPSSPPAPAFEVVSDTEVDDEPRPRGELVRVDDDRPRRRRRRDSEPEYRVEERHSYDHTPQRSAFGAAFGVSAGCLTGILVVLVVVVLLVIGVCIGLPVFFESKKRERDQEDQKQKAQPPVRAQ